MLRFIVALVVVAGCSKDKDAGTGSPGGAPAETPAAPATAPVAASPARAPAPPGCELLTQADVEALGKKVEKVSDSDKGKRCTFKLAGTSGVISVMTTGHKANHDSGRKLFTAEAVPGLGLDAFYQQQVGLLSVVVAERSSFFVQSTESEKENPKRKEELTQLAKIAADRYAGKL